MKQKKPLAVVTILLLLVSLIAITSYTMLNNPQNKKFYVGVTYGGSSIEEAKELIDKVKNHTNLFILASGTLQKSGFYMNEIGDYAISSNLNYAIYGSTSNWATTNEYLIEAKERWGEHFIGVYYNDEPGGEMLDAEVCLELLVAKEGELIEGRLTAVSKITKNPNGIKIYNNGTYYTYGLDGKINTTSTRIENIEVSETENSTPTSSKRNQRISTVSITYYPNGTSTVKEYESEYRNDILLEKTDVYTSENITKYTKPMQSYEQILKQNLNPIQTYDDAAKAFINKNREAFENRPYVDNLNKAQLNDKSILFFTADYGLYWWDYQSGYDMVLAELGWNNSLSHKK